MSLDIKVISYFGLEEDIMSKVKSKAYTVPTLYIFKELRSGLCNSIATVTKTIEKEIRHANHE